MAWSSETESIVPVTSMCPWSRTDVPYRNGWHGAANGCVLVDRQPPGDANRLCAWTKFWRLRRSTLVHETTTVTRRSGELRSLLGYVTYARSVYVVGPTVRLCWCGTSGTAFWLSPHASRSPLYM